MLPDATIPDATLLNAWADRWASGMLAMLWQSVVWCVVVGIVAWLLVKASPALRCWLWRIVAIKLLLVPIWPAAMSLPWLPAASRQMARQPVEAGRQLDLPPVAATADAAPDTAHETAPEVSAAPVPVPVEAAVAAGEPVSFTAWLMIAWAGIVAAQLVVLFGQLLRLRRLLSRARPAGEAIGSLVREMAGRLKIRRVPRVLIIDQLCSPLVAAVWRPTIVLAQSLAAEAPRSSLSAVIAHELAHVKRRDLVWNWIGQVARMFFFFHPLVHWIVYRIRLEGELACDAWAMLATGQAPEEYADLLVSIVGRLSQPRALRSAAAAAAGLDGGKGLPMKDQSPPGENSSPA
jgi:bla regulator protein blaR1